MIWIDNPVPDNVFGNNISHTSDKEKEKQRWSQLPGLEFVFVIEGIHIEHEGRQVRVFDVGNDVETCVRG